MFSVDSSLICLLMATGLILGCLLLSRKIKTRFPVFAAALNYSVAALPLLPLLSLIAENAFLDPLQTGYAREAELRQSRSKAMSIYALEMSAEFSDGLQTLMDEARIQPKNKDFTDWFESRLEALGMRCLLTNGHQHYDFTKVGIDKRSLGVIPLLHASIQLKTSPDPKAEQKLASTILMARDIIRRSFDSFNFLEVFLNSSGQLMDATGLAFLGDSRALKAFWTSFNDNEGTFWFLLGLIEPSHLEENFLQMVQSRETLIEGTQFFLADQAPVRFKNKSRIFAEAVQYNEQPHALSIVRIPSLKKRLFILTPMQELHEQAQRETRTLRSLMIGLPLLTVLLAYMFLRWCFQPLFQLQSFFASKQTQKPPTIRGRDQIQASLRQLQATLEKREASKEFLHLIREDNPNQAWRLYREDHPVLYTQIMASETICIHLCHPDWVIFTDPQQTLNTDEGMLQRVRLDQHSTLPPRVLGRIQ